MKFKSNLSIAVIVVLSILFFNCKNEVKKDKAIVENKESIEKKKNNEAVKTPKGMVWVEAKTFTQGAKPNDKYALPREKPGHTVSVDGFFIDATEVTNKQFKAFVDATDYITVAERPISWEDLKKELPEGTPRPHDSVLKPGSLIFNKDVKQVANMVNYEQWWRWQTGADWKHPEGPESSIKGKDNYPVVHIALEDALEYCKWANRRLPTEAEWESAAQGTNRENVYTWGDDFNVLDSHANTWQGVFPVKNEPTDGFEFIAPVKSYDPNSIGIYDMMGNVWEITSDLFNENYYAEINPNDVLNNPKGAKVGYSIGKPYIEENVIKGGSFLCNASYCASFRISAKMGMEPNSSSDHIGFRTVATPDMLKE
ncbi:formylglycine-generating enzyme family protein [Aestuariibaculum sediminum]|uniref:Formylglycine-generating enzyme family protein n=1 Tax=Aestuariibaculum sediminum TaxID=2770637 RepID=A0A8J6Q2A9_9FLAO|nr:formylglycine-generating enzyme family protein [Aestuariibaculum sediminum]MBD0831919.1 formylglycine-generating enzyme family protein [Aestuariibaculum sediminum]